MSFYKYSGFNSQPLRPAPRGYRLLGSLDASGKSTGSNKFLNLSPKQVFGDIERISVPTAHVESTSCTTCHSRRSPPDLRQVANLLDPVCPAPCEIPCFSEDAHLTGQNQCISTIRCTSRMLARHAWWSMSSYKTAVPVKYSVYYHTRMLTREYCKRCMKGQKMPLTCMQLRTQKRVTPCEKRKSRVPSTEVTLFKSASRGLKMPHSMYEVQRDISKTPRPSSHSLFPYIKNVFLRKSLKL